MQLQYGIGDSFLMSLIGMMVVFLVLIILMISISIISKLAGGKKREMVAAPASSPAPFPIPVPVSGTSGAPVFARGSVGEVKTFDVPDHTAAMVMAIVADQMGTPLNELRFKSIKETDAKK